jgi:thioredoxin 2
MATVELTDDNFESTINDNDIVLIDFWAAWCGPCRAVSPVLEKLAQEKAGQIKLVKVDVDRAPELSHRFAVQSIPTLLVISGGKVVARQTGAAPAPALRSWLEQTLSADRG